MEQPRSIHEPSQQDVQYPVRPRHIDHRRHFYDSFGSHETEVVARAIVILCKQRGAWRSLTVGQIRGEYLRIGGRPVDFDNGLAILQRGLVVSGQDGDLVVTDQFVDRCLAAAPADVPCRPEAVPIE